MTIFQATETYGAAVDRAVLTATRFGSPIEPTTLGSLSDMSTDELKKQLPWSLLHMEDGTFKFVPLERAVVVWQGVWSLSVKDHWPTPSSSAPTVTLTLSEVATVSTWTNVRGCAPSDRCACAFEG